MPRPQPPVPPPPPRSAPHPLPVPRPPPAPLSESGSETDSSLGSNISGPPRPATTVMSRIPFPVRIMNDGARGGGGRMRPRDTPQQTVDKFWRRFSARTPGKATTIIPEDGFTDKIAKRSAKAQETTTQASYEDTVEVCKAKVAKIVKECRRVNQKYRDPHFDLEFDLKWGRRDCLMGLSTTEERAGPGKFLPQSVKRVVDIFEEPQFYIDGATANDVIQGRDGDCWFLAALCNISNKPGLIERVCIAHDKDVGVYGFVFHRDGEWFSEVIDDKLYLTKPDYDESRHERLLWEDRDRANSEEQYRKTYQTNSGALYFAQCKSPNETWLPLLEKAYAKAHGDYSAIEGGTSGEGIEDLTGGVCTQLFSTDILDKEQFWHEELMKVNQDFLFGCSTGIFRQWNGWRWGSRKGIQENHDYSIMRAVEIDGLRLLLLKNPWGKGEWHGAWSDGSKEWTPQWLERLGHKFGDDGSFWISYDDLLRKYQCFDRVRLFDENWKVTQIWTTVAVPWTMQNLDTQFAFTLPKPGPVVLVLSQLDDRYFVGLEGQYRFKLSFRLHRSGQEDYVVRSQHMYWASRSVNLELDLEAGDYTVVARIDSARFETIVKPEEVIRINAKKRPEKLLRIGRAYDLAHSKGKIVETSDERQARQVYERRQREKQRQALKQSIMATRRKKNYLSHIEREDRERLEWKIRSKLLAKRRTAREKKKQRGEEDARRDVQATRDDLQLRPKSGHAEPPVSVSVNDPPNPAVGNQMDVVRTANVSPTGVGDALGDNMPDAAAKYSFQDGESSIDQGATEPSSSIPKLGMNQTDVASFSSRPIPEIDRGGDVAYSSPNKATADRSDGTAYASSTKASIYRGDNTPSTSPARPLEETDQAGLLSPNKADQPARPRRGSRLSSLHSLKERAMDKAKEMFHRDGPAGEDLGSFSDEEQSEPVAAKRRLPPQGYPGPGPLPPPRPGLQIGTGPPFHYPSPYENMPRRAPPLPRGDYEPIDADEDFVSVSAASISDLSDTELDYILETQGPPPPQRGGAAPDEGDSDDDFSRDPWNAVCVMGFRLYYRVAEEDRLSEVVKLRVRRPNPYADEEDVGRGAGKGQGVNGAEGGGGTTADRNASQALDVDDSAKDATLEGEVSERKKSISPPSPVLTRKTA